MATKVPAYSFSGSHASEVKNGYWYIYLKSSGTLKMSYAKTNVQACIVGGGAGGEGYSVSRDRGGHGGGGGAVNNKSGLSISGGTGYSVTIGTGGAIGANGGSSSAFGTTSAGGVCAGGNCGLSVEDKAGTNGGNGTYAFGDTSLARYGAGGGGGGSNDNATPGSGGQDGGGRGGDGGIDGARAAVAGADNTGSGGGGGGQPSNWQDEDGYNHIPAGKAASGGSGIVIIRGTQDDSLPVYMDGTQLKEMYFNGEKISGLIYGGIRVFARMLSGKNGYGAMQAVNT